MIDWNQNTVTAVGIALDLAAFVFIAINDSLQTKAESQLVELEDYITALEAVAAVPVEPLPVVITDEHRQFNEIARMVREAELKALKDNKQKYLAAKADVRPIVERRQGRNRIAMWLIGVATVVQLGALFLS